MVWGGGGLDPGTAEDAVGVLVVVANDSLAGTDGADGWVEFDMQGALGVTCLMIWVVWGCVGGCVCGGRGEAILAGRGWHVGTDFDGAGLPVVG